MRCIIAQGAGRFGHVPYLISGSRAFSYNESDVLIKNIIEKFPAYNIKPGNKAAILSPNGIEYVLLIHAMLR
ncbi:MAG: hypothetical protein ABIA63_13880, partial [bacterium]